MHTNQFNRKVTLQVPAAGQDAYGEPLTGWTNVVTVWASIVDVTGREYLAAAATQNAVQTKITIRHRSGVLPAMRVVHGADVYSIEAVLGQGGTELLLMCTRGLNHG
jgi:SPP1 family predicted phage head-tail adaptor